MKAAFLSLVLIGLILGLGVCESSKTPLPPRRLKLATTTSVENTGLLNRLLTPFQKAYNLRVDVIAVGSGKAMKLGERGDVDLLLVHSPVDEKQFIQKGFGFRRFPFMTNYFVLLGPEKDPARILGAKSAQEAFQKIYEAAAPFISRGDNSGTDKAEKKVWQELNINPSGKWFLETGEGMGQTLLIAAEKNGYVLTDVGSYLFYKNKVRLKLLYEGKTDLVNIYSLIPVNPYKHRSINFIEAMTLTGYLLSPKVKSLVQHFQIDRTPLFEFLLK